jgi:hypothetical protein
MVEVRRAKKVCGLEEAKVTAIASLEAQKGACQ